MSTLIAANWKMNMLRANGLALAQNIRAHPHTLECVLLPPATLLHPLSDTLQGALALGGQDCHQQTQGAYTGCLSAAMLKDAGCRYVLIGHSERRAALQENTDSLKAKIKAATDAGLRVIFCVGDNATQRNNGQAPAAVAHQLASVLTATTCPPDRLNIAYEPLWAIGSGQTPDCATLKAMTAQIRLTLKKCFAGGKVRVLYGGSVNAANAARFVKDCGMDGLLVGGASLSASSFNAILDACLDAPCRRP